MNRLSACARFLLFALCTVAICNAHKAMADTVTLKLMSTGSNTADGVYAYPYFFSINGAPGTTPLLCISFNNEITVGESWTATVTPVSGTAEEEASWLLNDANLHSANDDADQIAAWSLFANNVPMDGSADTQLALAAAFVAANPNDTSFYDHFSLYAPVDGTQSSGGDPQTFIGESGGPIPETVSPEPRSLLVFPLFTEVLNAGTAVLNCVRERLPPLFLARRGLFFPKIGFAQRRPKFCVPLHRHVAVET